MNKPTRKTPEVSVENHGSIMRFIPHTKAAEEWLRNNTDGEWFAGLVVEHRYAEDLARGLMQAGFTVR